jgi:hypothetical protein
MNIVFLEMIFTLELVPCPIYCISVSVFGRFETRLEQHRTPQYQNTILQLSLDLCGAFIKLNTVYKLIQNVCRQTVNHSVATKILCE